MNDAFDDRPNRAASLTEAESHTRESSWLVGFSKNLLSTGNEKEAFPADDLLIDLSLATFVGTKISSVDMSIC